jgi:hypothetical protein
MQAVGSLAEQQRGRAGLQEECRCRAEQSNPLRGMNATHGAVAGLRICGAPLRAAEARCVGESYALHRRLCCLCTRGGRRHADTPPLAPLTIRA